MIIRFALALVMIWALGFIYFAVALPQPVNGQETDAVIVPTGGAGRIERGLEVLKAGRAKAMLVTGVDPEVKPEEFAVQFDVPSDLMECCVTLGFAAVDTRSNAAETADWAAERNYRRLRLVTTDWHMVRAGGELERALPEGTTVLRDAVPSEPSLGSLFLEYHKVLATRAARLWDSE